MLKFFKDLLNENKNTTGSNYSSDSVSPPSERKLQLATCALFLEVAQADENFDQSEREKIISVMKEMFNLNDEEVTELIKQSDEYVQQSVSLYEFTDIVNHHFSKDERYEIVKNLWRLILVDEKVNRYEEHFVRTINANFHLEHKDMIAAKMEVKNEIN